MLTEWGWKMEKKIDLLSLIDITHSVVLKIEYILDAHSNLVKRKSLFCQWK